MRIGIIGTGSIADDGHSKAISLVNGAELVAVLSRDENKGRDFLARHKAADSSIVYTNLISFVNDNNIELAIICSPDSLHYEHGKACLLAGKHVLIEKPMTTSIEKAEELSRIALAKDLTLVVGFHLRSHVGHRLLKEKIESGDIGEIRHIRILWAWPADNNSNWRAESKLTKWWSLSAVGSHCLDLTRWFTNNSDDWQKYKTITASNVWNSSHDETAVVSAQLTNGAIIEVTSSVQFGPYNLVEVFGTKGIAVCSGTLGRDGAGEIVINEVPLKFEPQNPFVLQLQNIINHIERREPLNADAESGVRSIKDLCLSISGINQ